MFYIRMRQPKGEEQVSDESMLYQLDYKFYKDEKLVDFCARWLVLKDNSLKLVT